jgi:citrate lyase synthetase
MDLQLINYDFITLKDGKAYILTLITFPSYFEAIKPLLNKIAASFTLY